MDKENQERLEEAKKRLEDYEKKYRNASAITSKGGEARRHFQDSAYSDVKFLLELVKDLKPGHGSVPESQEPSLADIKAKLPHMFN